jgi:hypothetical protein
MASGLVPRSVARAQAWPQLAFVEVRDIAPSTLAIAWRSDNRQLAVDNFVNVATDVLLSARRTDRRLSSQVSTTQRTRSRHARSERSTARATCSRERAPTAHASATRQRSGVPAEHSSPRSASTAA